MDSSAVVKELKRFGLKKFITEFSFILCNRTVSPNQVASALHFSFDEIQRIQQHPESFKKCQELYELIQRKCADNVENFIEALQNSGNEHVITFIQSKLADSSSARQIPSSSFNTKTGIWFSIPEPIDSFSGREDFLSQLHKKLQNQHLINSKAEAVAGPSQPKRPKITSRSTPFVTVLSQVKIMSGLGGIGKTETATQYIHSHRQFYNNFIWIDAQSDNSMRNSFSKLANELKIPMETSEGKSREMEEIVKEIYNKICEGGKSNLIIFDNAEDYESSKDFFPFGLHPDLKKPVILATSRNQEWKSATGKLQLLPLDVLTDDESLEFILTQLQIEDSPEFREESREFIQLIGGLPLALQQAVAYIKNEKELREFLGKSYQIKDYVREFKSSMKKFLSFCPHPDSSATVFVTWNVTFQRIQGLENGEEAVKILELLSFLYADKIPSSFLHDLVPETGNSEFSRALKLLKKYSLIKMNVKDVCLSIHRQLQFVILQYLQECDDISKVVLNLVDKYQVVLKSIRLSAPECSDIFVNVHQIVKNQFDLIPMAQEYLDFMHEFGWVLWSASRYSESLDVYKKVHSKSRELFGENHPKTLSSQHQIALQLLELERYDESLTLFRETLKQDEIHLGPDHPTTIATKYNIAGVLRHQKKYDESLELSQQVLAQNIKVQGENHPQTLRTQNGIAVVHSALGDLPNALALYQDVEEKQTKILGADHTDVLQTKHNKASVLLRMGKLEEASKIFNEIYEKREKTLGENHLSTISTLEWIAGAFEQQGKLTQALQLFKKVYEIRKTNLGENHPDTIDVKTHIVNVETKLGENNSRFSD